MKDYPGLSRNTKFIKLTLPHRTTTSSPHCVHLLLTGEAGVSQEEPEDIVSGLIPGLPEAVYICGTDQSLGAPETPQRPLSHQNSGQQPRVQVKTPVRADRCSQGWKDV